MSVARDLADPELTVSGLMERLSQHLAGLAEDAGFLEQAIGTGLAPDTCLSGETIMQLQSLDRLRQSLEDLAVLSDALGQEPPGAEALDAERLSGLCRLDCTRQLLRPQPGDREQKGALDLF